MWFCANKLSLNAKKTKYIIVKPHSKKCAAENRKLIIDVVSLERIVNFTCIVFNKASENILPVNTGMLNKLYFGLIHHI